MTVPQFAPEECSDYIVIYCSYCDTILQIFKSGNIHLMIEKCETCGCGFTSNTNTIAINEDEAELRIRAMLARRKGLKMADIQIEPKCCACGKEITKGERIICVAEASLSEAATYDSRGVRPGRLRVNFLGTKKAVYHTECYKW